MNIPIPSLVLQFLIAFSFFGCSAGDDEPVVPQPTTATTGSLFDLTMEHGGLTREYLLYVPESYSATQAVPLVLSLHGAAGTKENQYQLSRFHEIADTANFILVTPEATRPANLTLWNSGLSVDMADDVGFINALIDLVAASYNIDRSRVYAAGSSNGGFMCFELACKLSDKIAAIAAVKGTMAESQLTSCSPTQPTPILQLHGTDDRNVPYATVAPVLDFWIAFNQTDTTATVLQVPDPDPMNGNTAEHILYLNGLEKTTVEHFRITGGEHDWFGEPGTNYDIDASLEAWRFFLQYDLTGRR